MEVESALVSSADVAEAAVVGVNHEIKGQALYAFVILNEGAAMNDDEIQKLRKHVGSVIGPIAKPDYIQIVRDLPKTRSGKIMRRIRKASDNKEEIGDTTTLADPGVGGVIQKEVLV
jgi:acetyl-CoA synthetase